MRRLLCRAGLLLGAVLLAAVRRPLLRKPRGPGRSRAKLAEVSGGARAVPPPPAREGGQPGPGHEVPEHPALARCARPAGAPTPGEKQLGGGVGRGVTPEPPGFLSRPPAASPRLPGPERTSLAAVPARGASERRVGEDPRPLRAGGRVLLRFRQSSRPPPVQPLQSDLQRI